MSTKKVVTETNRNPERHLIQAAGILITGFKQPANLLEFLTRSCYWIECYCQEKKLSGRTVKNNFISVSMIESLVHPWVKKGPNLLRRISKGIEWISTSMRHEGYFEYLALIIQGFGIDAHYGQLPEGTMKDFLSSMNTLQEVGNCIQAFDYETYKIPEVAQNSVETA